MRTVLELTKDAYQIAKTIAREQNRSMGNVVSELILASVDARKGSPQIEVVNGFPTFRCVQKVSSADTADA